MGPGVPGVGFAAVFYVALGLIAPLRELFLTLRGRSSLQRWRSVGTQFGLAAAVAGSVIGLYLAANALIDHGLLAAAAGAAGDRRLPNLGFGVVILAGVLLVSWAYAGWIRFSVRQQHPVTVAAAHSHSFIPRTLPSDRWAELRGRSAPGRDLLEEAPHDGHLYPWRDRFVADRRPT